MRPGGQASRSKRGLFPWTASCRAFVYGREAGVTKPLFSDSPGTALEGSRAGQDAAAQVRHWRFTDLPPQQK